MSAWSVRLPRLALWLVALGYSICLEVVYERAVSPIFSYQGMVVQDIPASLRAFQLILVAAPVQWLPIRLEAPSQFQAHLLYVIVYVPSVVIGFHICDPQSHGAYIFFLLTCAICLVFISLQHRLPLLRLPTVHLSEQGLIILLLAVSGMVCAALILYYGLPSDIFDIAAIYKSRWDFKAKAASAPLFLNYLYFWQGIVVNPILIILGVLKRRLLLLLLGISLQYLLFCITTLRSLALSVGFSLFIVFFMKQRWRSKGVLLMMFMLVAAGIGGAAMGGDGPAAIASRIFVQRWLAMQGQLSGAYVDFFSVRDKIYLGGSIFRGLVNYQYGDLTPGEVIGDEYVAMRRGPIPNATANFWADAFAQFGVVGVLGASAIAVILLWLADSVLNYSRREVAVMFFSTCALSLTEQGVQTGVLTGGLLPLLVIGLLGKDALTRVHHAQKKNRPFDIST